MPNEARSAFERRVSNRIREFDVTALLELLCEHGYHPIRFRGTETNCFRAALLEEIEFPGDDEDGPVTVIVNLGLMASQSPLPAYFDKILEFGSIDEHLREFLSLFDHPLLEQRFATLRPRNSESLLPQWSRIERDLLRLLDPRSPSTLDWLFRHVYPELGVIVERRPATQRVPVEGVQLNRSHVGTSAFGGVALADVDGLVVTLVSEDNDTDDGIRWEIAADQRLRKSVLPHLESSGIVLEVILEIDEPGFEISLEGATESYLSFDQLRGDPDAMPVRRLPLYHEWLA